jgi:hypothetical protein
MRVNDSAESAQAKSSKLSPIDQLLQWRGPSYSPDVFPPWRLNLIVEAQVAYIEQSDLDGEYPIELCFHDPVTGVSRWPIKIVNDCEDLQTWLGLSWSGTFISYRFHNRLRWRPLKVGWWTPDDVLKQLSLVGLSQDGVDFGAAADLLRDPSALKRKSGLRDIWGAAPMLNDQGKPDRSETWMWQAGLMRDAGASNEEVAAMLTLCRKTFADKFPRGLNDRRARKEIERVCSKLRKKQ